MPTCPKCGADSNEGTFCSYCGASLSVAAAPVAEQKILDEGGVQITSARVIIHGQTYAMANITSVKTATSPPNNLGGCLLGGIGVLASLIALLVPGVWTWGICAVFLGLAGWSFSQAKPTYHVVLGTAGGEAQALSSHDNEFVLRIAAALNDAIVHRG